MVSTRLNSAGAPLGSQVEIVEKSTVPIESKWKPANACVHNILCPQVCVLIWLLSPLNFETMAKVNPLELQKQFQDEVDKFSVLRNQFKKIFHQRSTLETQLNENKIVKEV